MRRNLKIIIGFFRLFKEELLNGFRIHLHGIQYGICSGVRFWIYRNGLCDIGRKTWFSEHNIIECNGGYLKLGFNNFFNTNCRIACVDKITIGDNNLFGPNVIIVDHNHGYKEKDVLFCKQELVSASVQIGSNNWIGGNVTICKGVTIHNNIIVGANSVVSRDLIEPGIYCGSPAIKIKDL